MLEIKDGKNKLNEYFFATIRDEEHSVAWKCKRIAYFLQLGVDINAKDEGGNTPLFFAKKAEVVEYLVKNGAEINIKNNHSVSPILFQINKDDNYEVIKKMVEKGADIDDKDEKGWTGLMYAVAYNRVDMVDFLIDLGANIEEKDKSGQTALCKAVLFEVEDCVKVLIARGADEWAKDNRGLSIYYDLASRDMNRVIFDAVRDRITDEECKKINLMSEGRG